MREATKRGRRTIALSVLSVLLASCGGGSGSTGLITSESGVVDDVRQSGTCDEFDATPYCGTDSPNAIAPGGQSVNIVGTAVPTPVRTESPAPAPTATAGGVVPTPSPASSAIPATPTPKPTASPSDQQTVRAVVDGFPAGAACATAARPAGSEDPWKTAVLVELDPVAAVTVFPLPDGASDPRDVALLCFDDPPPTLPAELATLADAEPTVIFVLPGP